MYIQFFYLLTINIYTHTSNKIFFGNYSVPPQFMHIAGDGRIVSQPEQDHSYDNATIYVMKRLSPGLRRSRRSTN